MENNEKQIEWKINVFKNNNIKYELKPNKIYLFPVNEKLNGYYVKFSIKSNEKQTPIIKFFEDYSQNKLEISECILIKNKTQKGKLYHFEKTSEYFIMYFKEIK